MTEAEDQPTWVCQPCGTKFANMTRRDHISSWHAGDRCGVCGKWTTTTEPRDFGYLVEGWNKR